MITIANLPVEVLHLIFMKLPWVEDFISVSKVCILWEELAQQRMAWVKYLIGVYDYSKEPENVSNDILYYRQGVMASYALKYLVPYLPNLRILEVIDPYKMDPETLGTIARDNPNIIGLRYDRRIPGSIDDCLSGIEMISTNCIAEAMAPLCSNLKQLYIRYSNERTLAIVSQHEQLERLHIHDFVGENFLQHAVQPFYNLIMLELGFKRLDYKSICDLDRVIRMCSKLESLYLRFEDLDRFEVDDEMDNTSNLNLKNVVLQYTDEHWPEDAVFPLIYRFINCKQLAIRDNMGLYDNNVVDLISELPNLELLDVRGCHNITQHSVDAIRRLSRFLNRDVKFFWGEHVYEKLDQYRDLRVAVGFNFNYNLFNRRFEQLPHFLDHYQQRLSLME